MLVPGAFRRHDAVSGATSHVRIRNCSDDPLSDMAATDKWVIFILTPLACVPLDLLQEGHKHFAWSEDKPLMFGILPRRNPKPEDMRWFKYKNAFYGHTGNAFDGEDGCVYLDAPLTYHNKVCRFAAKGLDSSCLLINRSSGSFRL